MRVSNRKPPVTPTAKPTPQLVSNLTGISRGLGNRYTRCWVHLHTSMLHRHYEFSMEAITTMSAAFYSIRGGMRQADVRRFA